MKTSKMLDGYPQRSCGGLAPPPLRGASRRYARPRSASRRSGYAMPALLPHAIASAPSRRVAPLGTAPASATAPPLTRLCHGLRTGLGNLAAVIPTHFVVGIHGWARVELARLRSLASASVETPSATHADLCPPSAGRAARVKISGVLRGGFSRALWSGIRRTGFGWGRARLSYLGVPCWL